MVNEPFISHEIKDRSLVASLKRNIHNGAIAASFNPSRVGIIDIVVAELSSNILKHADGGEFLYRFSKKIGFKALEIICLDNGPGIKDISHAMTDGVTTAKTLGHGLGALKRLSDDFHIYSIEKWGTICYLKIYADPNHKPVAKLAGVTFRSLIVSKPGETVSGDACEIMVSADRTNIFMGDGLGHGKEAHEAAQLAIRSFRICRENNPARMLEFVHNLVKQTRGLVGTAVIADHRSGKWKICGIGNIATRICDGSTSKNYGSHNGIIGLNIPGRLTYHETDIVRHQCLVMTSDGINSRWTLAQFPAIQRYDPLMLAIVIYKECARKNDDMSILIVRT